MWTRTLTKLIKQQLLKTRIRKSETFETNKLVPNKGKINIFIR